MARVCVLTACCLAAATGQELLLRWGTDTDVAMISAYNMTAAAPTEAPVQALCHDGNSACYLGIGWWVLVLYFFWAQAEVCDEYFVPTIEVITDRFKIPEDVAGATIMALGCNGPELFLNVITIFNPSDIGIGAVIGGEVFNVLVLIGCALLATPAAYMPLRIAKFSFTRDVIFYAYSVSLLYWVLADRYISWYNALVLLFSGALYSGTVALSGTIRKACARRFKKKTAAVLDAEPEASRSIIQSSVVGDAEDALAKVPHGPRDGCTVSIRVQHNNRMVDRNQHWDDRFVKLTNRGLVIDTEAHHGANRTQRGIVYDHTGAGGLTYAGLVNMPGIDADEFVSQSLADEPRIHRDDGDLPRTMSDPRMHPEESENTFGNAKKAEVIPTRDFVSCTPPMTPEGTVFELQVVQRDTTFGKLVRLDFDAKTPEQCELWVAAIMKCMQEEMRAHLDHYNGSFTAPSFAPSSFVPRSSFLHERSWRTPFVEWLDWLRFPVRSLLRATIPDVHNPKYRSYWPLAFAMSMVWLGIFAFGVIEICDAIHSTYGISQAILGFTLAAIGTSFPNVISCIAVSKQGRTGMAIANALGANIQNVFLALALPWTIQAFAKPDAHPPAGQPAYGFRMEAPGLTSSVFWMFGTLGLMVVIVLFAGCKMPKWSGATFLVIYAVFLTNQLGGEISGNELWPFPAR